MEHPTPLPTLVRLEDPAVCGCGEPVAAGERVGYLSSAEGIACLACMAALQAGRTEVLRRGGHLSRTEVVAARRRLTGVEHTAVVATRADDLVHRVDAARSLGLLDGEPLPLDAYARKGS